MARGNTPRQPARGGRQEGVRKSRPQKTAAAVLRTARTGEGARPHTDRAAHKTQSKKADNPIAPERVQGILNRLDGLYPDVTCALHHKSAWELLVATIL